MNLPALVVAARTAASRRRTRTRRAALVMGLVVGLLWAAWFWSPRPTALPLVAELRTPVSGSQYFYPWPIAFSTDGSMLAATKPGIGLALWDVASKKIRREVMVTGTIMDGVFDREGKHLAVVSFRSGPPVDWRLTMFQVSGEEEPITIDFDQEHPFNLAFSDDASELYVIARDFSAPGSPEALLKFHSWEVESGNELTSREWKLSYQDFFQVSPDWKTLLGGSRKKPDVTIWDLSTCQTVGKLSAIGAPVSNLCLIMPFVDAKTAGLCRQDGTMELWDLESRTLRKTFRGHTATFSPYRMLCSSDSNLMVSEAMEQTNSIPFMRQVESLVSRILRRSTPGYDPSETMLWDSGTGRVRARLPDEVRGVLSKDGKRMATTSGERVIKVWDVSAP